MKLEALGQSVENTHDWLAPTAAGKASATTQAPHVTACERPAGAAATNLSTAYPAAMAANHAPRPTCLFSEAKVCSRACSSGPSTAAAASTASSNVRGQFGRAAKLTITPHIARIRPVHDQAALSTDNGESGPAARASVVCRTPAR